MKKLLLIASLLSVGGAFGMQRPENLQKKMNTYTEEKAQLDLKYKETLKAHAELLSVSRDKELQDRKERSTRAGRKVLKTTGAVMLVGAGIGYAVGAGIGYAVGHPNPARVRESGMVLGALAGFLPGYLIGALSSMEGTNCI